MKQFRQADTDWRVEAARRRLEEVGTPPLAAEFFLGNYRRLLAGDQTLIPESEITPLERLRRLEEIAGHAARGRKELGRLVIIKLAGGLGTSMGLEVPKAVLPVKEGLTFLDITLGQVSHLRRAHNTEIPLLLMTSFATHEALKASVTEARYRISNPSDIPLLFPQNRTPKINADTLEPVRTDRDDPSGWCPPGHGEIYTVLWENGILEKLLSLGYRYAFVSNIDNLGATVDPGILGYLAETAIPFLMEVAERTPADRKGGHLARRADGRLVLRESVQCPPEDYPAFQDIERHRFFNTNNLWLDLKALAERLREHGGVLPLPLIVNRKVLNPRNPHSMPVFHLETAAGAAISLFDGAEGLAVPRSRFLPVKTTDDLLAVRSDIYLLQEDCTFRTNPRRRLPTIFVDLDHRIYSHLPEFDARFPHGPPSLLDCESLVVEGDFLFEGGVVLEGTVFLRNRSPRQILVPAGTRIARRVSGPVP